MLARLEPREAERLSQQAAARFLTTNLFRWTRAAAIRRPNAAHAQTLSQPNEAQPLRARNEKGAY
eukprot:COSAG06_NODE_406_length_16115_cov_38.420142_10_plen_65_part_00